MSQLAFVFRLFTQPLGHSSQILRSGGHKELVFGTTEPSQAQAIQSEDSLEVGKEHFHLLPIFSRLGIAFGCPELAGNIPRRLVDVAGNLPNR